MSASDVSREYGMQRGFLAWFGRKTDRGDGDLAIASYLAVFLVQATEVNALGQAIDAGMRERELGEAELTDA